MFIEAAVVIIVFAIIIVLGLIALFISAYKRVPQGKAIIRNGFGGFIVSFNGLFVIPFIHKMELINITERKIEINRTGKDGLISKDGKRIDVKADFIFGIIPTFDNIQRVAMTIGTMKANDLNELEKLFSNLFLENLKHSSSQFEAATIHQNIAKFKMNTLEGIGRDFHGFSLSDLHIYHLEKN